MTGDAQNGAFPMRPRFINTELSSLLNSKPYGGCLVLDEKLPQCGMEFFRGFASAMAQNIQYAKNELYTQSSREIDFCFFQSTQINAFAYASPDDAPIPFDFIGVSAGAILTMSGWFCRILSNPENFPEVGNPSLEVAPPRTFLTSDMIMRADWPIPNCPVRNRYANLLAAVCIDLLFFHELTHLSNGHLEYVREYLKCPRLDEMEMFQNSANIITRQTLEMDADAGAILLTLIVSTRKSSTIATLNWTEDKFSKAAAIHAFGSTRSVVRSVAFASYVLFRIFDVPWCWEKQDSVTHPLHAVRMVWSTQLITEIFRKKLNEDEITDAVGNDVLEMCAVAEQALARVADGVDINMINSVIGTSLYGGYLKQLKDHWQELVPFLEKNKRGGGRLADTY